MDTLLNVSPWGHSGASGNPRGGEATHSTLLRRVPALAPGPNPSVDGFGPTCFIAALRHCVKVNVLDLVILDGVSVSL